MADIEPLFPSTTWEYRPVKIQKRPQGHGAVRSASWGWRSLRRTDRRKPVRITVTYKGGPQSYWLVEARGKHAVVSGHQQLEDVMSSIHNDY